MGKRSSVLIFAKYANPSSYEASIMFSPTSSFAWQVPGVEASILTSSLKADVGSLSLHAEELAF